MGRHITPIFYQIKIFWVYLRPVTDEYFMKFLSSCSKIYDMQGSNTISVWVRNLQRFCQIHDQVDVDGCWKMRIKNWFKYVEGQTLGNIVCNLLVLLVRYVSVMIQRRSGTLRLWNLASDFKPISMAFSWIWRCRTEGQEAMNITYSHKDS